MLWVFTPRRTPGDGATQVAAQTRFGRWWQFVTRKSILGGVTILMLSIHVAGLVFGTLGGFVEQIRRTNAIADTVEITPANANQVRRLAVLPVYSDSSFRSVIASPGGTYFAASIDDRVFVWDATSGAEVIVLPGPGTPIGFSYDDRLLAVHRWGVLIWDIGTGNLVGNLSQSGNVAGANTAISPDFHLLALASSAADEFNRDSTTYTIGLWDINNQVDLGLLHTSINANAFSYLAFSTDSQTLAAAGCSTIEFERVQRYNGSYYNRGTCVRGGIGLWDVQSQAMISLLQIGSGVISTIAVHPDGHLLASASDNYVTIWDVQTGQQHAHFFPGGGVMALAWSPNGQILAASIPSYGRGIVLWSVEDNVELQVLEGGGRAGSISFSPDGRLLVTTSGRNELWLWGVSR